MEYRKMVLMNLSAEQEWKHRQCEQTSGHGFRGRKERYGQSNMETYITICKIDSQREITVWLREIKLGLCNKVDGCDGEGGERDVQVGGDLMFGRNQYNTVNQLSFF